MDIVTSRANPRVKAVRRLLTSKGRRELGQSILEGPKALAEALDAGVHPALVIRTASDTDTATVVRDAALQELVVSEDVLVSVSDTATPQGPVAVIDRPRALHLRSHRTVVLVGVGDPGNVGTILRTAAAFGWDAAVTDGTADPWSPKALRASAGATLRLHLAGVADPVADCEAAGLSTVALVVDGGAEAVSNGDPIALLVGSESHGLDSAVVDGSNARYTIPMPGGTESLNAAVSASIAMYALG
jgi:TrmH family RNA methyltransferase